MKRCPTCNNLFADKNQFCDRDGAALVPDSPPADDESASVINDDFPQVDQTPLRGEEARPLKADWKVLAMVAVAGIAIGLVLFLLYYGLTRPPRTANSNQSTVAPAGPQSPRDFVSSASPASTVIPSPEQSPSPSAVPPAKPAASTNVVLSSNEVSTSAAKVNHGPVTIRLTDGTTIEADEAWDAAKGIWYRKRGVVSFIDRGRVKAIEQPKPSPQPSASQKPSP